ncbi:hypothetical protein TWF718_007418 [Orbilia javanica]|uniref:Uncharacterized protein n=1 Tax=Orbilia javanica TaxID=47235 RepID=A0AAN8RJ03_9PEZI
MASPPPEDPEEAEEVREQEDQAKPEPKDPGFNKIHSIISGQIDRIAYTACKYPDGQIMEFSNITSQTSQQVLNWYKRRIFDFQLYRLRISYNPKRRIIQYKAYHPAGAALTSAFESGVTSWVRSSFEELRDIPGFNKGLQVRAYQPTPSKSPVTPKVPLLTPALAIYSEYDTYDTEFPPIVLDYSFSPKNTPSELLRHWYDLYSTRDLWFSHSKLKTQVVILAVFYPAKPDDDEGDEHEEGREPSNQPPRQNRTNNNTNIAAPRVRIHGRMDIWRYDKSWKTSRLTNEVVLFPAPSTNTTTSQNEDKITFTLQELLGGSSDFRKSKASGADQEDPEFVLDVHQLRKDMKAFQCHIWSAESDDRRRYHHMFLP